MTAAQPWMKFYPQDWRADEKLRMCSLSARGLWIEMLALMHRSERYGTLLINGQTPSMEQLAVQVGASLHVVAEGLKELETAGVFSRAAGNTIYSRRMKKDEKRSKNAHKNGTKGGNPKLRATNGKQTENQPSLNLEDNQQDKPLDKLSRTRVPDAICQIPEDSNYLPTSETETAREESAGRQADDLAEELVGMVGLSLSSPIIVANAVSQCKAWLADGIDAETCIKPVIRNCLANGGEPTRSLRRFDAVIRHDHAKRRPASEPVTPLPVDQQIARFEESASRLEAMGKADDAAEFRQKAERLRSHVQ